MLKVLQITPISSSSSLSLSADQFDLYYADHSFIFFLLQSVSISSIYHSCSLFLNVSWLVCSEWKEYSKLFFIFPLHRFYIIFFVSTKILPPTSHWFAIVCFSFATSNFLNQQIVILIEFFNLTPNFILDSFLQLLRNNVLNVLIFHWHMQKRFLFDFIDHDHSPQHRTTTSYNMYRLSTCI